jgi:hypothetical protein
VGGIYERNVPAATFHALKIAAGVAIIGTVDWGSMVVDESAVRRNWRSVVSSGVLQNGSWAYLGKEKYVFHFSFSNNRGR